ncbi:thiolase family protein [Balneolales bacterium ANBcel1]|nr:thiolase family protein [Balneolales bacterium ANBcel1]
MKHVVIIDALRTPIGSFGGRFKSMTAPQLASVTIGALYKNNSLNPDVIDEVIMGNALPAGVGQGPARQAALLAGLRDTIPCSTVNQVCASGMKAVMTAARQIACGDANVMVAGGMESMSNVPYYQPGARFGTTLGHSELQDGIIRDALQDPFKKWQTGNAAELCAQTHEISRQEQDEYAEASYRKAQAAQDQGAFAAEITSVKIRNRRGDAEVIIQDEEPGRLDVADIARKGPAWQKNGTVTSANSAAMGDGAAALLLMSEEAASEHGLAPLARIAGQAACAGPAAEYLTAPSKAIELAAQRVGTTPREIDIYELHEPFAVSLPANIRLLDIEPSVVNLHGGAVSLGNPVGCSGARVLVSLLHSMIRHEKKRGCGAVSAAGGDAAAMVLERF